MSGHSKWSQIKRQKGTADARRGTLYTKMGHMIALAAREGGKDPSMNFRLRLALEKARAANMPSATIERAIRRGAGELAGEDQIQPVIYEGYGPGGAAVLVDAATNNKNRTAAEVRHILAKYGGAVGAVGGVQWLFETRGIITLGSDKITEQQELLLIDAGAQDITQSGDAARVTTRPDQLESVRQHIERAGIVVRETEVVLVPKNLVRFSSDQDRERFLKLVNELENIEEVTRVTSNAQT